MFQGCGEAVDNLTRIALVFNWVYSQAERLELLSF